MKPKAVLGVVCAFIFAVGSAIGLFYVVTSDAVQRLFAGTDERPECSAGLPVEDVMTDIDVILQLEELDCPKIAFYNEGIFKFLFKDITKLNYKVYLHLLRNLLSKSSDSRDRLQVEIKKYNDLNPKDYLYLKYDSEIDWKTVVLSLKSVECMSEEVKELEKSQCFNVSKSYAISVPMEHGAKLSNLHVQFMRESSEFRDFVDHYMFEFNQKEDKIIVLQIQNDKKSSASVADLQSGMFMHIDYSEDIKTDLPELFEYIKRPIRKQINLDIKKMEKIETCIQLAKTLKDNTELEVPSFTFTLKTCTFLPPIEVSSKRYREEFDIDLLSQNIKNGEFQFFYIEGCKGDAYSAIQDLECNIEETSIKSIDLADKLNKDKETLQKIMFEGNIGSALELDLKVIDFIQKQNRSFTPQNPNNLLNEINNLIN